MHGTYNVKFEYFHVRAKLNSGSNNDTFEANDEWNMRLREPRLVHFFHYYFILVSWIRENVSAGRAASVFRTG